MNDEKIILLVYGIWIVVMATIGAVIIATNG